MSTLSTADSDLFLRPADQGARTTRVLSALMHLRRRLANRRRALGRVADHTAHDFRTVLTVVREYVSLLLDGLCGEVSEEQRKMLEVVCDRTDELNDMIDDLLDL